MEHPKYTYLSCKCQAPSCDRASHWQQIVKCDPQTVAGLLLVGRHHVPPAIAALGGLDPRHQEANEAGNKPQSPLQAIREKCRDCTCYQLNEIRDCAAVNWALWPFNKRPWRAEARKPPPTGANPQRQTAPEDKGVPSC